ncbi:Hypothetical protein LUCI_3757 [Lucifera butyrica]|uniref:Uncharacterized protein n=1 Tax=Lucifera butyrica TaxID=1351585 RepID=A0A498RBX4_9FIRM|nr:hypothetical protein [Lucifera butyrica]VBB08451.1 Hypothetical protein LUCI_3723 [Lucifera butyrica]VBB08485.1 Hypothetical protein LUCI_3757 [Lucifera butyrica]
MNCEKNILKCNACGSPLKLNKFFTGVEEGEDGKIYDCGVSLECDCCGRIYPLGCIKKEQDFVFPKQFIPQNRTK